MFGSTPLIKESVGYALFFLIPFFAQNSFASSPPVSEDPFFSEIPIILTATRMTQRFDETPVATSVIDRETILSSGINNVADLMMLVPGMQVGHPSGNQFAVAYHGNSTAFSRRMQVQIDGRSVYSPLYSIVDWTHLGVTIEDIERIEVIRGSNTPIDGTNAFIGTINIITRQIFEDGGISFRATQGSQSFARQMFRAAGQLGKFEHRLSLEHRQDSGFDQVNDSQNLDSVSYRGNYFPTETNAIDLQFGYSRGPEGIGHGELVDPNRDKETHSYYGYIRWQKYLSETDDLRVGLYLNRLVWSDKQDLIGPIYSLGAFFSPILKIPAPLVPTFFAASGIPDQTITLGIFDGQSERIDLDFRHGLSLTPDLRMIWGGGLRRDRFQTPFNLGRPDPYDNYSRRLNGHIEWIVSDRLIANAGAMLEYNDLANTEVSNRLSFNYHWDERQSFRLAVARSARMPSIYEARASNIVQLNDGTLLDVLISNAGDALNDSVKPELIRSVALGYTRFAPDHRLKMDVQVFKDQITSALVTPTVRPISDLVDQKSFVWMNAGNIKIYGVDLDLDYRPEPNTRIRLGYAYARGEGSVLKRLNLNGDPNISSPNAPGQKSEQTDSVPRHTISLMTSYHFPSRTTGSLIWYHLSSMEWLEDGDPVNGFDRIDLSVYAPFDLSGYEASVRITVQNLLNDSYTDTVKYNLFDRRMFLTLGLDI